MKTLTSGMTQHINSDATQLAMMWKITRVDATVLAFTDHDQDLEHDGVTYIADSGFARSSLHSKSDMSVDNTDLEGILTLPEINAADIRAGRYDGASIEIFVVKHDEPGLVRGNLAPSTSNVTFASGAFETMQLDTPGASWRTFGFEVGQTVILDDPDSVGTLDAVNQKEFTVTAITTTSVTDDTLRVAESVFVQGVSSNDFRMDTSRNGDGMGKIILRKGELGEIQLKDNTYVTEIRGLTQVLTRAQGEVTNALCRVDLYSARCGLNSAGTNSVDGITFKESDTVLAVQTGDSKRVFTANGVITGITGRYDQGLLTWTSGLNTGLSMEVKEWDQTLDLVTLFLPMTFAVVAGDGFDIFMGCSKRLLEDCRDQFDNVINFRGEPTLPGVDKMVQMADAS